MEKLILVTCPGISQNNVPMPYLYLRKSDSPESSMIPFRVETEVSLAGKGGAGSVELYGLADSSSALPSSDE